MAKSKKAAYVSNEHEFHLAFKEVNSGVNQLVIGVAEISAGAHTPQGRAITVPFNQKAADENPYDARLNAIDILFENVRAGNKIKIFTIDEKLHEIVCADPSVPLSAKKRFEAITEIYGEGSISITDSMPEPFIIVEPADAPIGWDPIVNDPPPKRAIRHAPINIADQFMRRKINSLLNPRRDYAP